MSASPEHVATSFDFPEGMGRCQAQLISTSVGQIAVLQVIGEVGPHAATGTPPKQWMKQSSNSELRWPPFGTTRVPTLTEVG
jgi:hypothetical protein